MNHVSWKKVLAAFAIVLVLSRSRRIIEFFADSDGGGILTFEPLRDCSEGARYLVTLALLALAFVIFWRLYLRKK